MVDRGKETLRETRSDGRGALYWALARRPPGKRKDVDRRGHFRRKAVRHRDWPKGGEGTNGPISSPPGAEMLLGCSLLAGEGEESEEGLSNLL